MSRKLKRPPPAFKELALSLTDDNAELGRSHRVSWPKIAVDGPVVGAPHCNPCKDPQQAHLLDTAAPRTLSLSLSLSLILLIVIPAKLNDPKPLTTRAPAPATPQLAKKKKILEKSYSYGLRTSTSILRGHLDALHSKAYLWFCAKHQLENQITRTRTQAGTTSGTNAQTTESSQLDPSIDNFNHQEFHNLSESHTYEEALEHDPIALGCNIVQVLRASGSSYRTSVHVIRMIASLMRHYHHLRTIYCEVEVSSELPTPSEAILGHWLQWAQKYYDCMQSDTYIIAMVLNPAYHMSWIKKHWLREGSDKAIQMHDSTLHSRGQEYRPKSPVKVIARAHKPLSLFETIGQEYGLEDDMLEFNIYFNGTTSPISTDILQFWLGKDSVKKLDNLFCLLAKDDKDNALDQNVIESSEGSDPEDEYWTALDPLLMIYIPNIVAKGAGLEPFRINGRFRLDAEIGSGSHGRVFITNDIFTGQKVIAKLEHSKPRTLKQEYAVYLALAGGNSILHIHWFGSDSGHYTIIMEHLGPLLEMYFNACNKRLDLQTVISFAKQLVHRQLYWSIVFGICS
ncbi:hypothetical protein C8R48DRAFT_670993 [Suillus tomentosus]|nr:hypothetical protein C8R48DRAFT_670993 [Suillus tomentosus]